MIASVAPPRVCARAGVYGATRRRDTTMVIRDGGGRSDDTCRMNDPDPHLQASVTQWLEREVGVDRPRRVVRADEHEILVSKFEPGFAAQLHRLLDDLPEILSESHVIDQYRRMALDLPADTPRVDAWHASMHAALRTAGERLRLE